jgi:hypothetical protein
MGTGGLQLWNIAEIHGMTTAKAMILKFTSSSGEKGDPSAGAAGAE